MKMSRSCDGDAFFLVVVVEMIGKWCMDVIEEEKGMR